MKSRHHLLFATALLLPLLSLPLNTLHAESTTASNVVTTDTNTLGTMLVTATRTEETLQDTLAPATVFTAEDIQRLQPHDLPDLLSRVPGVTINRNGGPGAISSVLLRGTNSDQTLILLDGQRISSATLGTTQLEFLDVHQIDRVEVVRGPRSSLYGSDAIGGVIQIFTKKGGEQGLQPVFSYGMGNHGTIEAGAGVSGAQGGTRFNLNTHYSSTTGINNSVDKTSFNGDEDAFREKSVSGNVSHVFDNGTEIGAAYYESFSKNEYDTDSFPPPLFIATPVYGPYTQTSLKNINAYWKQPVTDFWTSTVSGGQSHNNGSNFDKSGDPFAFSKFDTERDFLSWQNDFTANIGITQHVLTVGTDYYNDKITSSSTYSTPAGEPVTSRDNTGYFVQEQMHVGKHHFVLGLRQDDNEQFDRHNTGNIAWGYDITPSLEIIGSYGTAFKAPTFNDLYFPAIPFCCGGNPDLVPEESKNYELGLKGDHTIGQWSFNLFENHVDNLIQWTPDAFFVFTPNNVSKAKIRGAEFELTRTIAEWTLRMNASYLIPKNVSDTPNQDNLLPYRSRENVSIDIDRSFDLFSVGANLELHSKRYIDAANNNDEGGFGLVNLRAGYQLTPEVLLQAKVNNLFDQDYNLNSVYNTEGITYLMSVVYTPKL